MSQQVFIAHSIEVAADPRRGRVVPSSRKRSPSDYFRRTDPALPHRADRQRSVAFGEAAPGRVGHQTVVTVARGRQVQQRLQNAMDMRRRRQIFTARDQSHPLDRVVDGNGTSLRARTTSPNGAESASFQCGPFSSSSTHSTAPVRASARARSSRRAKSIPARCFCARWRESRPRHVPGYGSPGSACGAPPARAISSRISRRVQKHG